VGGIPAYLNALNEHTKQIAFFEVKWHEFERVKEAKNIIEGLKDKSKTSTYLGHRLTQI
jgi:hypothetical protein